MLFCWHSVVAGVLEYKIKCHKSLVTLFFFSSPLANLLYLFHDKTALNNHEDVLQVLFYGIYIHPYAFEIKSKIFFTQVLFLGIKTQGAQEYF